MGALSRRGCPGAPPPSRQRGRRLLNRRCFEGLRAGLSASRRVAGLLLLLACLAPFGGGAAADAARFFVVGDAPYSDNEFARLGALLDAASAAPFLIHVGDIKGGGQTCTDARMSAVAELFKRQPRPVLYTPGDNEWTDCHRRRAGAMDPLERLDALRRTFFADPAVLHNAGLDPRVPDPAYPEDLWLRIDDLALAMVHVVGSNNNADARAPAAVAELNARTAANRALLEQVVAAANSDAAAGLVIAFHANPMFLQEPPAKGFAPILKDLEWVLANYPGPVLVIHGDTHGYRFDQPWLQRPGGERLWRLEVPGSPRVGGVQVGFDAAAETPFSVALAAPP